MRGFGTRVGESEREIGGKRERVGERGRVRNAGKEEKRVQVMEKREERSCIEN